MSYHFDHVIISTGPSLSPSVEGLLLEVFDGLLMRNIKGVPHKAADIPA
jgi:hypothetical protein